VQRFVRRVRGLKLSKEEKETQKATTKAVDKETKGETCEIYASRIMASEKGQEFSEDEQSPIMSRSRQKPQARTLKSVIPEGRKSSEFRVQQLRSHLENPKSNTASGQPSLDREVPAIVDHRVEDAIAIKDNAVELPAERVTEVPDDTPDSEPPMSVPGIAQPMGTEDTTVLAEIVARALPLELDKRSEIEEPQNESSQKAASPGPTHEVSFTSVEDPVATTGSATKLDPSYNAKELARLISKELMAAAELMSGEEDAQDEEIQDEELPLHAWVSNFSGTLGADILPLQISGTEIQSLIDKRGGKDYSLFEALSKLNTLQRQMILRSLDKPGLTLLFVYTWAKEKVISFFGDLEIILLLWSRKDTR
jgi:hypothetical protein